jgi:hypothetical protein
LDYIPNVTPADVVRVIARDFPHHQHKQVLALLHRYSSDWGLQASARTHLAILKLSEGDFRRLEATLQLAREDFRDVIAPAEYPEWCRIGFVGAEKLPQRELEALKTRDWEQYQAWLRR